MDFLTELEGCVPSLRRYARALLHDMDAADDLVQDCLERALSRRHLWRGGLDLRPWLFRILHNVCINEVRARRTRPVHESIETVLDLPTGPEGHDARLELQEMEMALDQLVEEQRQVILLIALTGLSYRECAQALDVPIGTIMSRLARGRERLRELLGNDENEPSRVLRRIK